MPNDDEEIFSFDGANSLNDFLRRAVQSGEGVEELASLFNAESHDLTTHFTATLYAMDADHLIEYFRKVEIRVGERTIGIGMEVRSDYDPKTAPEADKVFVARALTAILRAGGVSAIRKGKRVFVHQEDCDGSCGVEHEVDPFGEQVAAWRAEIDTVLGTDPPDEGWDRWMGRG